MDTAINEMRNLNSMVRLGSWDAGAKWLSSTAKGKMGMVIIMNSRIKVRGIV